MPIISVIVPVYNVEKYLCRCVDSILAQTFTDFELILVDDGSPDSCGKICDEYAKKDSRVVVIHKENGGLSDARNAGIDRAFANSQSEWITFIDSDDWVHKDYLSLMLEAAVSSNADVSVCGVLKTGNYLPDEEISDFDYYEKDVQTAYLTEKYIMIACAKLYKKDAFLNIKFPVGRLHEDIFTTYKILFSCQKIAVVNHKLYYYYFNENSIVNSKWTPKRLDEIEAHREQIDFFHNAKYNKAYKKEIYAYLWVICEQIKEIDKENSNTKYKRILTQELRKAKKQYKDLMNIKLPEYAWLYETMHPTAMRIYWTLISLKKKILKGERQ